MQISRLISICVCLTYVYVCVCVYTIAREQHRIFVRSILSVCVRYASMAPPQIRDLFSDGDTFDGNFRSRSSEESLFGRGRECKEREDPRSEGLKRRLRAQADERTSSIRHDRSFKNLIPRVFSRKSHPRWQRKFPTNSLE